MTSVFAPAATAYAGVTLGLLHGSQPDANGTVSRSDPGISQQLSARARVACEHAIAAYLSMARLTNPEARFVGVSLNTSSMNEEEARLALERTRQSLGLPCVDPIRSGVAAIVKELIAS